MASLSRQLARWIVGLRYEDLPPAVIDRAKGVTLQCLSSVLIGELVAGDGFFSPKEGSEIVMKCVVGEFYGDAVVARKDTSSKQITVDGNDDWYLESHLTFDIPNLVTKGETAIVVIVDTGADSSSLYYASIPDTADPALMADARRLVGELKVSA